jgi:hypothetical protein
MEFDAAAWSGEGTFTQALLDVLRSHVAVAFLRVEDAPASRADSAFSFISNEIYVGFAESHAKGAIAALADALELVPAIGAPDYADEHMLQYLRTERIVPAYQTRGFKLIEMVRIYELGTPPRDRSGRCS